MGKSSIAISVKGKAVEVPVVQIRGNTIVITGRWLRMARLYDEEWRETEPVQQTNEYLRELRAKADLFSFAVYEPDSSPKFPGFFEWDNRAVVNLSKFEDWWDKLPQESRKNVRRSQRRGVTVRMATLDDALVSGIKQIYDETPLRQGRRFWHYGKDIATIKLENSTYADRSDFIGAYFEERLIGFIKLVYVGRTARIMQILSMNSHFDKRPANALLARAVERCCEKKMTWFEYGKYIYENKSDSPITEFKRRNGFEDLRYPRYYLPVSVKGRIILTLGLHRGLRNFLPQSLATRLLDIRSRIYQRFLPGSQESASLPENGTVDPSIKLTSSNSSS